VLVEGTRCKTVGTVSMDSFAVELPHDLPAGAPVTLIGDGLLAEEHAQHAGTITYELTTGLHADPDRSTRQVLDA
jgi:alanine racemase